MVASPFEATAEGALADRSERNQRWSLGETGLFVLGCSSVLWLLIAAVGACVFGAA